MTNKKFPFEKAKEIDFMDPIVQENWFDAYDLIREESPAANINPHNEFI